MKFKIFTPDGSDFSLSEGKNVLALGTFDGVHIAHKALLSRAIELKNKLGASGVGAWCFSDAPASYLKKKNIPLLTTLTEKVSIMLDSGLDFIAVGDFADYCQMLASDFVSDVLISELNCVGAVCGFNHRFGYGGLGDSRLIEEILGKDRVITVNEIKCDGETVSSSTIRALITSGNIEAANKMLGRAYSVTSTVISGKQLGRQMSFPTANILFHANTLPPKSGIYATICRVGGEKYLGVSNVGTRPTITDGSDSHVFNCETYIIGFSGNIYGCDLTVEFHKHIRDEMKFSSVDELRSQIQKDTNTAIEYFSGR